MKNRRAFWCADTFNGSNMIASALRADVTDDAQVQKGVAPRATPAEKPLLGIAVSTHQEIPTISDSTVQGSGPFWGVRDDTDLAAYDLPVQGSADTSDALPDVVFTQVYAAGIAQPPRTRPAADLDVAEGEVKEGEPPGGPGRSAVEL